MATQLQLRRGTTQANDLFTGANGEVTVDTTKHSLRVHDGSTQGGYLVDTVVFFQRPTADNNYTWARKYASGWVEQGGKNTAITTGSTQTQTFPIPMADTNYTVGITLIGTGLADTGFRIIDASNTTTAFAYNANSGDNTSGIYWRVEGMAA